MATSSHTLRSGTLGAAALLLAAACSSSSTGTTTTPAEHLESTRTALIAEPQLLTGQNNGDKVLILTFDDGPGPMNVTGELSGWLKDQGIKATFFVNGACIEETDLPNNSCPTPTEDAAEVLRKITADGHLVANHTTTHRSMTGESDSRNVMPARQWVADITETDDAIKPFVPWNKFLFRAPFGDFSEDVYDALQDSPMNKYVGPIYWSAGGGPTSRTRAADWECWDANSGFHYTTKKCGDLYLKEIASVGSGIVLMHEAKGNTSNHSLSSGVGNTVDMVKYIVPILKSQGYTFMPLWEDADVADLLPRCDGTCTSCAGPTANDCTACPDGKFLSGGTCKTCSTCQGGVAKACDGANDTVCVGGAVNETVAGGTSALATKPTASETAQAAQGGCSTGGTGGGASTFGLALGALALVGGYRRRRAA